ncbi:MAG: MFS transporter [Clostridiales bacterium]|jgi:DHA3 family macrolide efflux protein-like MFS transporter|nr:MFS transporter [Clostridiales bacterium]
MESSETPAAPYARWERNAALFLGGQAVSMFGSMLVAYAIFWHITLTTDSGAAMTWFSLAASLPIVVISPLAGVWADRYNRKYIINIADGAIALVTLVMAALFAMGADALWLLILLQVFRSLGQGAQMPAVAAVLPQLVPEKHLARMNGINAGIQSAATLAAPAFAGLLLSRVDIQYVMYIDVATAAIGIAIVFFCVRVGAPAGGSDRKGYLRELVEGVKYCSRDKVIRALIIIQALWFIVGAPGMTLTPLQVARTYGDEYWRLTAIEIAFSGGMLAGGFVIGAWGGFKRKFISLGVATAIFAVGSAVIGIPPAFWIYLSVMAVMGVMVPLYTTPMTTLVQTRCDPNYLGRVFSVTMIVSQAAMPLSMTFFGPLADRVPIESILIVSGALLAALGVYVFTSPTLRSADNPI